MKKLYTVSLALLSLASFGQANRIVLIEEFTGENCPPCAAANPGFDAIVSANPNTAVMLKHQVPIPSAGPIYLGWTTDADARRSYYGVTSAPNGRMDGGQLAPGASSNHPASFTQSDLTSRAAVSSSFSMTTTHTLSSDLDSIFITITVQNVDGFIVNSQSAGSLRLHVAVIEEDLVFASPPGTNGESEFYHVNRKMYPDAAGTAMADSWNTNQSQTFTFAEELPMHIYNYNEIGVVAYIQENGDKSVHQASYSAAVPAPTNIPDMTISNATGSSSDLCAGTITPEFEIENVSSATATTADVQYRINGGAWVTQPWTGSLSQNQTATVTFPQANLPFATNTIEARVANPNGSRDVNNLNNNIDPFSVNVISPIVNPSPFTGNFENAQAGQVPNNMILNGNTSYNTVIDAAFINGTGMYGGFAASNKSMLFGFYYLPAGEVGELIFPKVDISSEANAKVHFNWAHQSYNGENDALEVLVSGDCGVTWTSIWAKSGSDLITTPTPTSTSSFFANDPTDWKATTAYIPNSLQNSQELIVKFVATSAYGNNLFIDDVNIAANKIGVEENTVADAVLFPNPADRSAELSFEATESGMVNVTVLDINGRAVNTITKDITAGAQSIQLNVADLPAGVYMVKVQQNENVSTLRLNVTH
ncbi:MAG: T9SS type A sorting domain-containing protein [Flavobacteriia bacterium]|nr:T9SS type A sorting domain-containing protein [Flavobacteriia bacterium]